MDTAIFCQYAGIGRLSAIGSEFFLPQYRGQQKSFTRAVLPRGLPFDPESRARALPQVK
jgi:hypothetical protein